MDQPAPNLNHRPLGGGTLRFGSFEVNLRAGELRKAGIKIKLHGQSFDVLAALLESPGELVTREELQRKLWRADTFVDFEHGLNKAVNKVREALGDDADNPRFIETLPRRGYRFIAPMEKLAADQSSSKSSAIGNSPKSRRASLLIAVGALATVLAGGGYFYVHRSPKLTEKDPIIVADFTNTTGDPAFDGALHQGLSIQLEQSPFFNVLSGDRIADEMRLMEKPTNTRLSEDVARDLCKRLNAKAEIEGSIATLGNQYVLGLDALNCRTGEIIAQEQVTADAKTKVLDALGKAASELRSKLGESRASLAAHDVSLAQATTPSLEALEAFSRCEEAFWSSNYATGVSFCQRAVAIDPAFANAYGLLGILYANLGLNDLVAESVTKAYELSDRTSEREKLVILATYHLFGTQDLEKTVQVSRQYAQVYPHDERAFIGLGTGYRLLGQYDNAEAAHLEVIRLDPGVAIAYEYLALSYIAQNRLDQAESIIASARARSLDSPDFNLLLCEIDFLRKDSTGMAQQASRLDPMTRSYFEAATAAFAGQLSHSRSVIRDSVAAAAKAHFQWVAAGLLADSSVKEALFGNFAEAKSAASQALTLKKSGTDWDTEGTAAFSLGLSGDTARAGKLAGDLNRHLPEGTFMQFLYLPAIRAAVLLDKGRPQEAIETLRVASPYELTPDGIFCVYLRGQAYLAAGEGPEAAGEFQKVLDHPGLVVTQPIGPLAHLGLGRAYSLQGGIAKAQAAYRDFFEVWKDADADIPILKQAKAEYAKLK
jgi:eukaryotic-like serine/threonine-protein kinase